LAQALAWLEVQLKETISLFRTCIEMLRNPSRSFEELRSTPLSRAFAFLLALGAVTAFLTPLQVLLGFEDVNGLHAGGAAEYLAKDLSSMLGLNLFWRIPLIQVLYVVVAAISTGYLHAIFKLAGGKASIEDTFRMICYGDAPGLLFGWVPYFATSSAVWAASLQLLLGPIVIHGLSWSKASFIFGLLIGLATIEVAMAA
jgi:hypothetical protein